MPDPVDLLFLANATAESSQGGEGSVLLVLLLLGMAATFLVLEFLMLSFGLLGAVAAVCAGLAIGEAFAISTTVGWTTLLLVPILGALVIRQGLRRLQRSRLATQSVLRDSAGAQSLATKLGVSVDCRGTMITRAMPTGRARFDGGSCDVRSLGGPLDPNTPVRVLRIDGPEILVMPLTTDDPPSDSDATPGS